jgi:hypothetical protein
MTTDITQESKASAFGTLVQMFTEPSRAFETVKTKSMVWLPLILLILSSVVLFTYYFQVVDFAWMVDRTLAANPDPAVREAAAKMMTKDTFFYSSIGGAVIVLPIALSIMALYFLIIAKVKKLEFGFTNWFTFVTWAAVPGLIALPLGIMQIMLASNGQLGMEQLNPTSINQLFFHFAPGHAWQGLLDSIQLPMLWSIYLMVIGYQVWAKSTRASALVVVIAPYAVIYGIWAAVKLLG